MKNIDVDLDELSSWVSENYVLEYSKEEIFNAQNNISKSDVFRGRIMKNQYWRFLVYQSFFISCGVALSKNEIKKKTVIYKRPKKGLSIFIGRNSFLKYNEFYKLIKNDIHLTYKEFYSHLKYLKSVFSQKSVISYVKQKYDYDLSLLF
jgi:hypothetical protein